MNFKEQLGGFKQKFDLKLATYLEKQKVLAQNYNPTFIKNLQELSHISLHGGKRFRPAMAYFGHKLVNNQEIEDIWTLGIALELFHCFALIHDDIIDKSFTRRGIPTLEAVYREYFSDNNPNIDINHFSTAAAILGGDFTLVLANQILTELKSDVDIKDLVVKQYYKMQFELVAGQEDDCFGVGLTSFDKLEESAILAMIKNKSGNYSIQQPLLMGAMLGKANENQLNALKEIGEWLGLVFQIQDDILGLFGDEEDLGKSNKIDIYEGKRTLLMYKTYQRASDFEKQDLLNILGKESSSLNQIEWVKNLVKNSGALDEMTNYCEELIKRAKHELVTTFGKENEAVIFLQDLADYLHTRKS